MNAWRLLTLETHNAYWNMAADEAVLIARIENRVPNTLRFFRWNPSAVSIGKFQNVEMEVNLENCRKYGVDVVRRITGGGTVYHDSEGEVTYSVVASKEDLKAETATTVYAKIYGGIAEALKFLGVKSDFSEGDAKTCPNLTVNGRKISGSAQSHKRGVVLQHGTLLLDVNLERMFLFLRVPWAKTCMEVVNVAKHKITSLKSESGISFALDEVCEALAKGFEKALGVKFVEGELTSYERGLAERLCREKYATEDWNLRGTAQS